MNTQALGRTYYHAAPGDYVAKTREEYEVHDVSEEEAARRLARLDEAIEGLEPDGAMIANPGEGSFTPLFARREAALDHARSVSPSARTALLMRCDLRLGTRMRDIDDLYETFGGMGAEDVALVANAFRQDGDQVLEDRAGNAAVLDGSALRVLDWETVMLPAS